MLQMDYDRDKEIVTLQSNLDLKDKFGVMNDVEHIQCAIFNLMNDGIEGIPFNELHKNIGMSIIDEQVKLRSDGVKIKNSFTDMKNENFNPYGDKKEILTYYVSAVVIGIINDFISNSIDAKASNLKMRFKYNRNTEDLIVSVSDNGLGTNAKTTEEKRIDSSMYGGKGNGFRIIKSLALPFGKNIDSLKGNFKFLNSKNGASVGIKLNSANIKKHLKELGGLYNAYVFIE